MRDIVNTFMSRRVDGLILTYAGVADKTVDLVRSRGIPVVLLNRGAGGADECQVVPDMETGIDQAVGHLVSLGHRHIAHLAGPKDSLVATGKAAAFRLAMTKRGLAVPDPAIAATRQVTDKDAAEASRRLMAGFPALTAVVAANDIIALAFIETARAIGRECPSDVSVVGFNDMPFVDRISPRLTTIRIPHHDMGYKAAALLIQQIDDPGARIPGAVFPTELVIRGSTRALVP
jgi:LacI family transcriptional regulator